MLLDLLLFIQHRPHYLLVELDFVLLCRLEVVRVHQELARINEAVLYFSLYRVVTSIQRCSVEGLHCTVGERVTWLTVDAGQALEDGHLLLLCLVFGIVFDRVLRFDFFLFGLRDFRP